MPSKTVPNLAESWSIFINNVQPRRLLQEEPGVKGPLWLFSKPTSSYHVHANVSRLAFAISLAPFYLVMPALNPTGAIKRILWSIEWAKSPNAVLLEAPGSLIPEEGELTVTSRGQYAVTGNKPRWLLEVEFCGTTIVSQKQVRYEWEREKGESNGLKPKGTSNDPSLRKRIQRCGYVAISYAMSSAEQLFQESLDRSLEPEQEIKSDGKQKYRLPDRQKISQALLDEYARSRTTVSGKQDGTEFIWLDEFCLSDDGTHGEEEIRKPREAELGRLADIFRGARRVVVFCHVEDCDHTGVKCPWGNRLFTMGEILYTPEVLQMTRTRDFDDQKELSSFIAIITGSEFRSDMQACAAEAKQWHLYNIMQHATNSGAVPWQSAIHSLVVEAIRRDEADNFHAHRFLGKALNGLLPRRSQLEDLQGVNGWADLAWLLELNQAYYNPALLAAVCKLADDDVEEYRWWGKPISPKEGSERLEALVHAIPVMFPETADHPKEPALSIVGPKSVSLSRWLQRDSAGLYRNTEMRSLMWCAAGIFMSLFITFFIVLIRASVVAGLVLFYVETMAFSILQLLVGTIFVEKRAWVVIEDHTIKDRDAYRWLQSQDPTYGKAVEWGARQLIPEWDTPRYNLSLPGSPPSPYAVTLIDLRSGVFTRAAVTKLPNDMVALAVHGSGVTCMLLDRNQDLEEEGATAVKVGMANFPPFVLAQAEDSGTVHIGSRIKDTQNRGLRSKLTRLAILSSMHTANEGLGDRGLW